jgi:hypothetical protein
MLFHFVVFLPAVFYPWFASEYLNAERVAWTKEFGKHCPRATIQVGVELLRPLVSYFIALYLNYKLDKKKVCRPI